MDIEDIFKKMFDKSVSPEEFQKELDATNPMEFIGKFLSKMTGGIIGIPQGPPKIGSMDFLSRLEMFRLERMKENTMNLPEGVQCGNIWMFPGPCNKDLPWVTTMTVKDHEDFFYITPLDGPCELVGPGDVYIPFWVDYGGVVARCCKSIGIRTDSLQGHGRRIGYMEPYWLKQVQKMLRSMCDQVYKPPKHLYQECEKNGYYQNIVRFDRAIQEFQMYLGPAKEL